jgi:uncharacterized membrane protein
MFVLLFLHLATVFTGISLILGSLLLALLAERSGHLSAIAAMTGIGFERFIGPTMILGGLFGLLTAITFGYSLIGAWLLIAYVLFVAATVWGIRVSTPTLKSLSALVADGSSDGGTISPDVSPLLGRLHLDVAFTFAIVLLLIADMVFKPFLK